jgi:hypothetical protein
MLILMMHQLGHVTEAPGGVVAATYYTRHRGTRNLYPYVGVLLGVLLGR